MGQVSLYVPDEELAAYDGARGELVKRSTYLLSLIRSGFAHRPRERAVRLPNCGRCGHDRSKRGHFRGRGKCRGGGITEEDTGWTCECPALVPTTGKGK